MGTTDPPATGLEAAIASFVPDVALGLPPTGGAGVVAERDAVLLLADISGFTALARSYAGRGPDGVERLSARLNDCFGELVDTVLAHGGDIANFAGDAFLALWTREPGGEDPVTRAVACGLAAQARMARHARAPDPITMRLGVAAGQLGILRLGGVADRWELVLSGDVVARVAELERVAPAGAVVVGPEVWERLPPDAVGDVRQNGPVRVRALPPQPPAAALRPLAANGDRRHLMGFLPRAIVARLQAGQGAWLAELRTATTVFAALPHATVAGAAAAQALTVDLQRAIYDSEGSVVKLIVDNKGLLLFCAFGLPPVSHADDALRAVSAALAVARVLADHDCPAAVGVATGPVFCGSIGNDRRRDYTLLGDTVNRSARLMQQAGPGREILVDAATRAAAGDAIRFREPEPLRLKGSPEPVLASVPVGPADSAARRRDGERAGLGEPLVGRGEELARLGALLDGHARLGIVAGEAGIGKTRVLEAFAEQAAGRGRRCLIGSADALQRSTPYGAWRAVLGAVLGPGDAGLRARATALGLGDPGLFPLLGPLLGVDLPPSELTARMSAEERADSTLRIAAQLLAGAARERPLLVLLDDVQWLDSASWLLVRRLLREDADLLLVVAHRPTVTGTPGELAPLLDATAHLRLELAQLPEAAGEALVADCLGATVVPDEVHAFIRERAGGHPFYRRELALALREAGAVGVDADGRASVASAAGLERFEVPATVAGIVASRIERLPPDQQLTLKVASVVGRSFLTRTVGTVHPLPEDRPRVPAQLEVLAASAITALEAPPPESAYAFSHAITHEITYNLMTFGQRRELHSVLADHYERTGGPGRSAADVAFHWERADAPVRALPHLVDAGRAALEAGAYGEALDLLERAVAIDGSANPGADPVARAGLLALAGQAALSVGRPARSLELHLHALELLERPFPDGTLRVHAGFVREAARQVANRLRGGPRPQAGREAERSRLASRSLEDVMQIVFHEEDPVRTGYCVLRVLNLCEAVPDSPQLGRAFAAVEPLVGFAGLRRTAARYARLSAGATGPQTTPGDRGLALEYEAIYAATTGDWAGAEERLERALVQFEQVGNARRTLECRSLLGIVAMLRGDLPRAGLMREELHRSAVAAEDRLVIGWTHCQRAEVAVRTGRPDDAIALLGGEAEALIATLGRSERLWRHGTLAEAHLRRGDHAAAHAHARDAQALMPVGRPSVFYLLDALSAVAEVAHVVGDRRLTRRSGRQLRAFARAFPIGAPRALLWVGMRQQTAGRPERARPTWEAGLLAAEQLGMPRDAALLRAALGRG